MNTICNVQSVNIHKCMTDSDMNGRRWTAKKLVSTKDSHSIIDVKNDKRCYMCNTSTRSPLPVQSCIDKVSGLFSGFTTVFAAHVDWSGSK